MTAFPTFASLWPTANPPLPQSMHAECSARETRGALRHVGQGAAIFEQPAHGRTAVVADVVATFAIAASMAWCTKAFLPYGLAERGPLSRLLIMLAWPSPSNTTSLSLGTRQV